MTERSRFWDGAATGDATTAPYDAATEFSEVMMSMTDAIRNPNRGVVYTGLDASTTGANNVRIALGQAQVYGAWYQSDANVDIVIPTPAVSTRYDQIVLRKSWSSQTIRLTRIAGAEGGVIPALTQVAGTTWDFPIAVVRIVITTGVVTTFDARWVEPNAGSRDNLLTNPGFEVLQRSALSSRSSNGLLVDFWNLFQSISTFVATQESTIVDASSSRSLKIIYTHGASGYISCYQSMKELVVALHGKTVTFSVRVRSSVAASVYLDIYDGIGNVSQSTPNQSTGAFETLTVSRVVSGAATDLQLRVLTNGVSCTYYLDNATAVVGSVALEYIPLNPAEETNRCLRYYQEIPYYLELRGYMSAGNSLGEVLWYQSKGGIPTVTKVGTWAVTNCAQPTLSAANADHIHLLTVVTALGLATAATDSSDDMITVEYNP